MTLLHLLLNPSRWATESQSHARRNAMIASTALAQRRAEREEVEAFFADLGPVAQVPQSRRGSLPVLDQHSGLGLPRPRTG